MVVAERDGLGPNGDVVAVWQPRPDNPFHGRLHQRDGGFAFWASDAGWYDIAPGEAKVHVSPDVDPLLRELRLFGIPAAVCAFAMGDLPLHAAAADVDGMGILFGGPSRHGKTTLAAGFAAAGHRLLAEDTIRCTIGSPALVHPGPAVVRLRADVAPHLPLGGTNERDALPADESGRVPRIFSAESRGSGEPLPLAAVILLLGGADRVELTPMAPEDAVRDLFALAFRLPTASSRAATFGRVADLVAGVEVLGLRRPVTIDALPDVVDAVVERLARSRHG